MYIFRVQALHTRLHSHLALMEPGAALSVPSMLIAAGVLSSNRLLLGEPGWKGLNGKVSLIAPRQDVVVALRGDPRMATLLTQIS
jgi:hypothetical protein